jgi:hypothetical protein
MGFFDIFAQQGAVNAVNKEYTAKLTAEYNKFIRSWYLLGRTVYKIVKAAQIRRHGRFSAHEDEYLRVLALPHEQMEITLAVRACSLMDSGEFSPEMHRVRAALYDSSIDVRNWTACHKDPQHNNKRRMGIMNPFFGLDIKYSVERGEFMEKVRSSEAKTQEDWDALLDRLVADFRQFCAAEGVIVGLDTLLDDFVDDICKTVWPTADNIVELLCKHGATVMLPLRIHEYDVLLFPLPVANDVLSTMSTYYGAQTDGSEVNKEKQVRLYREEVCDHVLSWFSRCVIGKLCDKLDDANTRLKLAFFGSRENPRPANLPEIIDEQALLMDTLGGIRDRAKDAQEQQAEEK